MEEIDIVRYFWMKSFKGTVHPIGGLFYIFSINVVAMVDYWCHESIQNGPRVIGPDCDTIKLIIAATGIEILRRKKL